MHSPLLIVFEGIDGSGKTTQAKLLYSALKKRGYNVVLLSEPTDGKYGRMIRKKLVSGDYTPEELYNLFVLDRKENARKIAAYIREGKIVVMDRYYISTLAYQGAQGIPIERILKDHKDLPQPNVIIILDMDPREAIKRISVRDTFEKLSFLRKVRDIYLRIPDILDIPCCSIIILDAGKQIEELHKEIFGMVIDRINKKNGECSGI